MRYVISIDWLALFCTIDADEFVGVSGLSDTIDAAYPWQYHREDYGTRQFNHLTRVSMPNEEGGRDEFAEVQSEPCSKILHRRSVIVRFVNRVLYRHDFWDLAAMFMRDNKLTFQSISRVDICADFNDFATLSPYQLIEGFAEQRFRHIGRGVGALYFDHGVRRDSLNAAPKYGVRYTGLSFGTHSSDARVYLYNKSFELATQGDKPWIRDRWMSAGLDVRTVWRLEVSLKSKACKFRDETFNQNVVIDTNACKEREHLQMIYHTFVRKLFSFIRNREGITNVTREKRLLLFSGKAWMERSVIRNITGSNRLDRMVIKALYTLADVYRGTDVQECASFADTLANVIASSTDLEQWFADKSEMWDKQNHR